MHESKFDGYRLNVYRGAGLRGGADKIGAE
jgi:hypothetical protein